MSARAAKILLSLEMMRSYMPDSRAGYRAAYIVKSGQTSSFIPSSQVRTAVIRQVKI